MSNETEWVLVPREPTPEMWEAGMNCHSPDDTQGDYLEKAWSAMLAAAPQPPAEAQPAADGGFSAADMMDARQEGRKEAQQPAAVDGAWDELGIIVKEYLDDPHTDAEYVMRKIAVLAALRDHDKEGGNP